MQILNTGCLYANEDEIKVQYFSNIIFFNMTSDFCYFFLLVFAASPWMASYVFYAGSGLLSPFNLWLESGAGGSKHTSSHYLIINPQSKR